MTGSVSLPLWLEVVVFVLAAVALFERLLAPGVKWHVRRRVARVLDEVDVLLSIRIQLFELTKRQVHVDHLLNDPAVLDAVEAASREEGHPRDGVYRASPPTPRRSSRSSTPTSPSASATGSRGRPHAPSTARGSAPTRA